MSEEGSQLTVGNLLFSSIISLEQEEEDIDSTVELRSKATLSLVLSKSIWSSYSDPFDEQEIPTQRLERSIPKPVEAISPRPPVDNTVN